ncbi:MAG: NAD(P)-dependent oxidoreductase [Cyanobacteria bacterium TGS_CYA1]|nr:NAD(P)-dependent oxidoreductase [Cyanobacteria bacterium TGS_CYA1]
MGGGMAANLAKQGHACKVWNRSQNSPNLKRALDAGCSNFPSISEAVREADIIFTCLSEEKDLDQIILGNDGIAEHAKKGAIIVDMATTGPGCSKRIATSLAEKNLRYLDAPVSGGDVGASEGTLTIMVGGEKEAFDKTLPYFECMGKTVTHCGPHGAGQAVKLCNQILCAVNLVGVCEAFALADKMEIDRQMIVDICGAGAAASWALSTLGPRIARDDLAPGFRLGHMLKDLNLVKDAAETLDLPGVDLSLSKFDDGIKAGADVDKSGTQSMILAYQK